MAPSALAPSLATLAGRPLVTRYSERNLVILLPRSGSAAPIYYRGRAAATPFLTVMERAVRPGMDAIDVGSHVGEYALLAAALVVPSGRVYAFEPQEALCG